MKQHNKTKIIFSIVIMIILGICTWYLTPVKKDISTSLCSTDGEQINVIFNVSWHRYIANPTELRGTITLNESIYYSLNETNFAIDYGNVIDRLIKKLKNEKQIPWFILSTNDVFDIHDDYIQLLQINKNFDAICMMVSIDGRVTTYYGPAETAEEANKILSRLSK